MQQWSYRAYLCLRCGLQVTQPIAQPLGGQAELAILLLDAGHALEHHFIILSRQNGLQSVHECGCCECVHHVPREPTHMRAQASPLIRGDSAAAMAWKKFRGRGTRGDGNRLLDKLTRLSKYNHNASTLCGPSRCVTLTICVSFMTHFQNKRNKLCIHKQ